MKIFLTKINKKVFIGVIVSILIIGGAITGIIFSNYNKNKNNAKDKQKQMEKDIILLKDDLIFEINSELTLLSLVSEDNKVKIISEDEAIDTSTLGEKEITIKYEANKKEEVKNFKITIEDTIVPIIEYAKELSTTSGTKIDLLKDVKVSDNSKEEIKVTVEGEYDFNKEGTYNLKYVAVDSSNNKKEEDFTLKVNKKTIPSTKTNAKNGNKPQPSSTNSTTSNTNSTNIQSTTNELPTCSDSDAGWQAFKTKMKNERYMLFDTQKQAEDYGNTAMKYGYGYWISTMAYTFEGTNCTRSYWTVNLYIGGGTCLDSNGLYNKKINVLPARELNDLPGEVNHLVSLGYNCAGKRDPKTGTIY